jgi:hypothetical protein
MITYMRSVDPSRAVWVTERVYALDEPWRSRFLHLIASYAQTRQPSNTPSRADVLRWLGDERLNEQISLMLHSWTHCSN